MRSSANEVLRRLNDAGFEAYLVGGCVRDLMLGRVPKDYDVTTNALPDQIQAVFPDHFDVGKSFGCIKANIDGDLIDIATYRSEQDYSDGRRPDVVKFETDVKEDVKRRDFTINGLLMDANEKVIDHVGGLDDLHNKLIRCIGNPEDRLREDYLRILRGFRFSVQLNFSLTADFLPIAKRLRDGLGLISKERIAVELEKMLTSQFPSVAIHYLMYSDTIYYAIPEVRKMEGCEQPPQYHKYDVFNHTMKMLDETPKPIPFALALSILLHDIGKPRTKGWHHERITFYGHEHVGADMAKDICERLKLSNAVTDIVVSHVKNHMRPFQVKKMKRAKLIQLCRLPNFEQLLELHRVDCLTSMGNMETYDAMKKFYDENKDLLRPDRLITGDDLIALGYPEGPQIGAMLKEIEELQLNGHLATKAAAKRYAYNMMSKTPWSTINSLIDNALNRIEDFELNDPIGTSTLLDEDDIEVLRSLFAYAENEAESIRACALRDLDLQAKNEYNVALNVLDKARKILGIKE